VHALREMSAKPSSIAQAARILRISAEGVRKTISHGQLGVGLRDRVIDWLAEHDVIRDATVPHLLDRYGSTAKAEHWTWQKVLDLPEPFPERQTAKKAARMGGVPIDAVVRVCSRPPWVSKEYRGRPVGWWTDEMKRVAEADARRKEVPPERVAELVHAEFKVLQRAG